MSVPDRRDYVPDLGCWMLTGEPALRAAVEYRRGMGPVALDIETPSVTNSFTLKCVTFAYTGPDGRVLSALLDPRSLPDHTRACAALCAAADLLVLHQSPFDVPGLVAAGCMTVEDVWKVYDTLLDARMAWPDTLDRKDLSTLATRLLRLPVSSVGMATAFKAAGYRTLAEGYEHMGVESPVYRMGAMADTAVTLRIAPLVRAEAVRRTLDHPFDEWGVVDAEEAETLLNRHHTVNRVMLRRNARGLAVDLDYLHTYRDRVQEGMDRAEEALRTHHIRPGVGTDLMAALEAAGEVPADWPRTATGKLSTAKDHLAVLEHPLADLHRQWSHHKKIIGYLEKVTARSQYTGRLHPQTGILAASATGRMSYSEPELQQFPEEARPIVVDDGQGLSSIDWAQIEPVTLANMARDRTFLTPFEQGADLYEPIMRAAGIPRKTAKVVLLASMYGQGITKLARTIHTSTTSAAQIQQQMRSAMPQTAEFMRRVSFIAQEYGLTLTAAGRVLVIPSVRNQRLAYKGVNFLCVSPQTPILTADLRHVPADSVSVGDRLVGFDEHSQDRRGRGTGKRFFRVAVVEDVRRVVKPSVEVRAGGRVTVCSADHLWLTRRPGAQPRLAWTRADALTSTHQLLSLGVWDTDGSRDAGYLAGLYDGEGSMSAPAAGHSSTVLIFSQNTGEVMDRFCALMRERGLTYSYVPRSPRSTPTTDSVRVTGMARIMRTVGTLRPERFVSRAASLFDGAELHTSRQMESVPFVESVTPIGDRELVSIQTSTRTLVADGYLSHNCQGSATDILHDTVVRMVEAGVSDHLQLAMHDELVVDTEAAEEVQRLMTTPPEFLTRWAGRVPVLRTDRADMGHAWASV